MSLSACAEIVRRGDPDRFLAAMAAPLPARRVLLPLYAFNVEVARAPWVTEEPMIAEMRLQWWRDALEEIGTGQHIRRHEVVDALATLLDTQAVDLLDRLIQARRWDIYRDPFEDAAHFEAYLTQTSAHLVEVAARCLGVTDNLQAVRDIGWASGLANWFLAIPDLEARGRKPLVDGRTQAVSALAQSGLDRLARARPTRAARPALLATWRARAILRRAARQPARVAEGTLGGSEFSRRASLLWRSLH